MPALDAAGAPAGALGACGAAAAAEVPGAESSVARLCEARARRPPRALCCQGRRRQPARRPAQVTGGRCYAVGSLRALLACVEALAQRLGPAAVASFRPLPCADAPQLAQLADATLAVRPPPPPPTRTRTRGALA